MRGRLSGLNLLLALGISSLSIASPRHTPEPIPLTITLQGATAPMWVDASIALDKSGSLSPTYFPEDVRGFAAEVFNTPILDGCHQAGPAFVSNYGSSPRENIDEAIEYSDVVIRGTVTGRSYGFYGSVAGQLLQIKPERVLGSSTKTPFYYFFVPVGDFDIGDTRICKRDPQYSTPPDIGDAVFLFTSSPTDAAAQLLPSDSPGDMVKITRGGMIDLPPHYIARRSDQDAPAPAISADELWQRAKRNRDGKKGAAK